MRPTHGSNDPTRTNPAQLALVPATPDGNDRRQGDLEDLLGLRYDLARLAGELRSHHMPETGEVELRQNLVEGLIREIDPTLYSANVDRWLDQDYDELTHAPGEHSDTCRVCRFLARRKAELDLVRLRVAA